MATLLVAVAFVIMAWVVAQVTASLIGWDRVSDSVIDVGTGALGSSTELLIFLASSILVLRITHALADSYRDREAHGVESRSEILASACSGVAVVVACLVQPAAWSRPESVGTGIFAVVLALASVAFASYIGRVFAPDARTQLAREEAELRSRQAFVDTHIAASFPTPQRAYASMAVWILLFLVAAPVTFGAAAAAPAGDAGEALRTGGMALSLGLASVYAIGLGQLSSTIDAPAKRRLLLTAALVLGCGGWAAVAAFEVYGYAASGNAWWLVRALAFTAMGGVCAVGATTRRVGRDGALHAAVISLRLQSANRSIAMRSRRVAQLRRILAQRRAVGRPRGGLRSRISLG